VINTKYYFVTYETRDGEREYRESGVLKASSYTLALKKAIRAKRLYTRYGWGEFCASDEIREITSIEYTVLKRFMFDIDSYFDGRGKLIW
jgi:hypothetical protein